MGSAQQPTNTDGRMDVDQYVQVQEANAVAMTIDHTGRAEGTGRADEGHTGATESDHSSTLGGSYPEDDTDEHDDEPNQEPGTASIRADWGAPARDKRETKDRTKKSKK